MIRKFRKKPVVIEALLFTGDNHFEVAKFVGQHLHGNLRGQLLIPTPESPHEASPGDWIIKGVKGEFYPCKPEIFDMTYEAADDS